MLLPKFFREAVDTGMASIAQLVLQLVAEAVQMVMSFDTVSNISPKFYLNI